MSLSASCEEIAGVAGLEGRWAEAGAGAATGVETGLGAGSGVQATTQYYNKLAP